MKLKKSSIALIVLVSVLSGAVIGVSGADTFQQITAELRSDFTVKYNGEVQVLADANGNQVYPITYNGSTYVPFRALGNMLDLDVGWDPDTKTVMYDTPPAPALKGVDVIDKCSLYYSINATVIPSSRNQQIKIGGETVDHWIRMGVTSYSNGVSTKSNVVTFDLGGDFNTLTLRGSASYDTLVTVYNNHTKDSVLGSFTIKAGEAPSDHAIYVGDALQIRIETSPDLYAEGNATKDDYAYLYNLRLSQ